ncbi:conserved hypothetical protein [Desulfonatronospira thiodismutans ASO3-1]|uniref:Uncharacterized protein n=1 Tax=Desulfonatronospira thiodismutans ASO3-1 TaxID=555779 RepID=D6SLA6_9BACT|nr:hypothetical protein [Desulfonatronospira thiodismutans]EFI35467.1 conserved hypothetical protein [Desulfonatronospira thiodismutans ASO3-1]
MIIIDGHQTDFNVSNFNNLEDLLVKVIKDRDLGERVVTDVLVNEESFSEIYPHQAEDVDTSDIEKVEIRTMDSITMAMNITRELYKVVTLMSKGGSEVAELFRQGEETRALEMYQDLLSVVRDFMNTVTVLKQDYQLTSQEDLDKGIEKLSELFSEMIEVQEKNDWNLLADLLEYEFLPLVDTWKKIVSELRAEVRQAA